MEKPSKKLRQSHDLLTVTLPHGRGSVNHSYSAVLPSPIGNLGIYIKNNKLTRIRFAPENSTAFTSNDPIYPSICQELLAYFQHPQHCFQVALHLEGTPFQIRVWDALRQVAPGTTISYQHLATQLQTSPRAIGNACRANPVPIIIPCHRIIAKQHIGGYCGETLGKMLQIKKWLLHHENPSAAVVN